MRHERFGSATVAARVPLRASRRAVWAALLPRRRGDMVRFAFAVAAALVDVGAILATGLSSEVLYSTIVYGEPVLIGTNAQAAGFVALFLVLPTLAREEYGLEKYLAINERPLRVVPLWIAATVLVLALGFATKTTSDYSRVLGLIFFAAGLPVLVLARRSMVRLAGAKGIGPSLVRRVHLVGYEEDIEAFHRNNDRERLGLRVVGTSILRAAKAGADARVRSAQIDEDLALAVSVVRFLRPDDVFVLMPWSRTDDVERCVSAFLGVPAALHLRPEGVMNRFAEMRLVRTGQLLGINVGRQPLGFAEVLAKRAFDLVLSGIGLLVLSPILAAIAVLIRLDGPGPILFVQQRYGFNQQPFRVFKFRSMRVAPPGAFRPTSRNDDRVTRVGRWLRRWNLDELPQLLNVLKGDMSLVGPRPHALAHDRSFERRIALYARRHNVKPGITGWAQVNGYRGETITDADMRGRVEHDLHYIDRWSLWLDIRIILMTLVSAKAYRNAY